MIEQNTAHSHLSEVGDHDFETKVLTREAPVIVDFSADWCPPCRAIAPVYDALSDAYEGKLLFLLGKSVFSSCSLLFTTIFRSKLVVNTMDHAENPFFTSIKSSSPSESLYDAGAALIAPVSSIMARSCFASIVS